MGSIIKIIGVGSPYGDDRLGWIVAEKLKSLPICKHEEVTIDILILDRPGAALISQWKEADAVILVDAIRSSATPGTLHMLSADNIDEKAQLTSSHGFGVASAIALARSLDELPEYFYLCGIEIDPANTSEGPGGPVSEAINHLVDRIEKLVSSVLHSLPTQTII